MTTAKEIAAQIEKAIQGIEATPTEDAVKAYNTTVLPSKLRILLSALSEAEKERDAIDTRMRELCAAWLKRAEGAEAEGRALRAELAQARKALGNWKANCGILLSVIDYISEATGETPDPEDAALVAQIQQDWEAALITDTGRTEGEQK